MIVTWAIILVLLGFFWNWLKYGNKRKFKNGLKELPGPKGLPIIGNILDLGKYADQQMWKWAKEFGPIYQVNLGRIRTICISDPKLCKEIFNDPMTTGRVNAPEFDLWEDTPGLGVFASDGELWSVHRRFLLRHLRDFGFGKSSMETGIMEEVKELLEMYKTKCGKPVTRIRETMRLAVVNSLWYIISSERFDQNDPRLLKLANNTSEIVNDVIEKGGFLFFAPWIKHQIGFPKLSGYTALREILEENRQFFIKSIENHKKRWREDDKKDFIDVYLAEMEKHKTQPESQFYGEIAERQLAAICFDLFSAGSDSTATITAWTCLYLCKFSQVQVKFHREIFWTTGDVRNVFLSDKPNMPYTMALIDEILRFSSITPDGVPHRTLEDFSFHGYHISKDSLIQPGLWFIHHDPRIWGDPEVFRPERFLSEDGKKYVKNENLMAFQVGRRICLGETLARDQIFLFLTNLFQQFSMKFDPSEEEPGLESEVGFLRAPKPFKVIMTDRLAK